MHDHEIDLSCVYTLKDCLFGAVKLSKTIIQDPGYGIGFDSMLVTRKKKSEFLVKIQHKD